MQVKKTLHRLLAMRLAPLLMLLCSSLALASQPPDAQASDALALDTQRLAAQLARQAATCVSFEQQRWIAALESQLTSSGYFHRLPEGLVWQTLTPVEERVLLSADNPELSTGMRALLPILSGLLEADWSRLEAHFEISSAGDSDAWRIDLRPRDSRIAEHLEHITLAGGVRLDQMDIQFTNGDRLSLVLEPVACSSLPQASTALEGHE